MAKYITQRQQAILNFIIESIRDNGYPPTIAEICEEFGIKSTNGVNDHLVALERKGYIERSNKARDIRLTDKAAAGFYKKEATSLPLVGQVAAGQPILAQENVEEHVTFDTGFMGTATYCLRVRGDSMIEDGIFDGDLVVIDQARQPKKGDIVVALIEDEATVKRFYPQGSMVELRPANAAMQSIYVPADQVQFQGVVVGLQRRIA